MDTTDVQIDTASQEGAESTEQTQEGDAQAQPLTEEILTQRIDDAVAKAIGEQTELARREIQSVKDKSKAEVEAASRRTKTAEQTISHLKGTLKDADPDTLKELELAELRSQVTGYQGMEQEGYIQQQQAEFDRKFQGSVTQHITELGIDPSDKRIDWGSDASNYLDKRERIDSSVRKIIKENTQNAEANLDKKLKEEVAKMRGDLGLDSVDTSNPVGTGSDADFLTQYSEGKNQDHERAQKILIKMSKGG